MAATMVGAEIRLILRGETPATAALVRDDAMAPTQIVARGEWCGAGLSLGQSGAVPASVPVESDTRRHLLAMRSTAATTITPVEASGQAGFGWDGGTPAGSVELTDYPDGVFAAGHVQAEVNQSGLYVSTNRMIPPDRVVFDAYAFVEGEDEDVHRVYPGTWPS